jgi:DNA topoisomerase-1
MDRGPQELVPKELVIVESPAKAKTIAGYLGPGFQVLASYGHVRDLVEKDGSVDPDRDFAMRWDVPSGRDAERVRAIADAARKSNRVLLATDPDREGEAISWHLAELLAAKKAVPGGGLARVTFNAVTRDAVKAAIAAPRHIDQNLVDAYLARRALDYLVGFTLSPVLWRKLPGARSAGRVQSVALRLIVEREAEIEAFVPREYWTVDGRFDGFDARLVALDGKRLGRFDLPDAARAEAARARVADAAFRVSAVEQKPVSRNPAPPFTTSTLQQEAARKLGLSAADAMRVAQRLYEAGHITYMRTDGVAMASEAIDAVRLQIAATFAPDHLPERPRFYSTKAKNAQEAHEAIRPTDFGKVPERAGLSGDEARLYALVWKRAVASQMAAARLERTTIDLASSDGAIALRATGSVVTFPGFLALYAEGQDEPEDEDGARLPPLKAGDTPPLRAAVASQHFTEPPPRYTEASLVKRLEELGIGRPSTYASIIEVLKDRSYVRLEKKRFHAEDKGRLVSAFLERFFERYVAYDFTASLEGRLDDISAGEAAYTEVLRDFWEDFHKLTAEVLDQKPWDIDQALDAQLAPMLFPATGDGHDPRACPSCGDGRLALRVGRYGPFISCSNYPDCKYRRNFGANGAATGPQSLGTLETGEPIQLKSGKFGPYLEAAGRRVSAPESLGPIDEALARRLLSLPREIGPHPETGLPIIATMGSKTPYLKHDGRYANLESLEELFAIGMNAAVVKLAEAATRPKFQRAAPAPLKVLGVDPASGAEVRLMSGRYGPYLTDGTTNANVPKGAVAEELALDEALVLIAERAAAGPARGKRKGGRAATAKIAKAPKAPKAKAAKAAKGAKGAKPGTGAKAGARGGSARRGGKAVEA